MRLKKELHLREMHNVVPEAGYTHDEIKISNQFLDGIKQERGINSLHKKIKTFPLVYILGYRSSSFPTIGREFGDRYPGKKFLNLFI